MATPIHFAHLIAPVKKGRKKTFWYPLTQVHMDSGKYRMHDIDF